MIQLRVWVLRDPETHEWDVFLTDGEDPCYLSSWPTWLEALHGAVELAWHLRQWRSRERAWSRSSLHWLPLDTAEVLR